MTTKINNEQKKLNVPNLRFPEFQGEWEKCPLGKISTKITKKNKGNTIQNVLCNSATLGLIPQNDYFDREIANSNNTDSYYVIEYGDFVYNPRKSVSAPYGPVNIYTGSIKGIISPLYLCFSVHSIMPSFLYYRFKSSVWFPYVYSHGNTGTRFDRVSIKDDVFFEMPIYMPSSKEQIKIANLMALLDERIATQNKIIDKLQSLIKGLNDSLYAQYGDKVLTSFAELGTSYSGLSGKSAQDFGSGKPFITYLNVYSNNVINENDFQYVAIKNGEKQNIVEYGDVLFTLSSETPEEVGIGSVYLGKEKVYLNSFCLGIHITNKEVAFPPYLSYYVSSTAFRKFIYPYAQGSTRFNLCKADFEKASIKLPTLENQKRIYSILSHIDSKIETERQMLDLYNSQKQYLLRQMFI